MESFNRKRQCLTLQKYPDTGDSSSHTWNYTTTRCYVPMCPVASRGLIKNYKTYIVHGIAPIYHDRPLWRVKKVNLYWRWCGHLNQPDLPQICLTPSLSCQRLPKHTLTVLLVLPCGRTKSRLPKFNWESRTGGSDLSFPGAVRKRILA